MALLTYPSDDQNPVGQQHPSGCSHPDCAPDEQTEKRHQREDDRDVNEAEASAEPVTGRAGGDHGGGSKGSDNDRGHFRQRRWRQRGGERRQGNKKGPIHSQRAKNLSMRKDGREGEKKGK